MQVSKIVAAGMVLGGLLASTARAGEAPAASPPAPLRAWNVDLLQVEPSALPETLPPGRPVSIVGARNGTFSGKVMVAGGMDGLKASITDLTGPAGKIAAGRVLLRFGADWQGMPGWYRPHGLDMLLDAPREGQTIGPVWVTVSVPEDAAAGTYKGTLTLQPAAGAAVRVPVELRVTGWVVPSPGQFRTYVEMIQSPDTLAVEYDVPLWSDEHWALIAHSFDLMKPLASRVIYLPVICHTNFGNEQSMVRWIKKDDGTYDYDFSILEKYVDTARQHMGEPDRVVINAWDVYLKPADNKWDEKWWNSLTDAQRKNDYFSSLKARGDLRRKLQAEHGNGPAVSVMNGDKVETVHLADLTGPASEALWKPLFDQLRARLKARGLEDAMTLGMLTDQWPSREEVAFLDKVSGGLPWVSHAHWSAVKKRGGKVYDVAAVGYETCVWDIELGDPDKERTYGWQRDKVVLAHYRMRGMNGFHPTRMRCVVEVNITGEQRGLGRIGGDVWWAIKNRRGDRKGTVTDRYPQSLWRNLDVKSCILAPGPDGAVPTARYEYFRESLEEGEARIAIEKALLENEAKLGAELAGRCRALLTERLRAAWRENTKDKAFMEEKGYAKMAWHAQDQVCHEWFRDSNWQDRTERLYGLAGEVAGKLGTTATAGR